MSANFSFRDKRVRPLEKKVEPEEAVTAEDVKDPQKLSQLLQRLLKRQTELERRWSPRRIDFENIESDGSSGTPYQVRLAHMFDGPVRWWAVNKNGTDFSDADAIREAVDASGALSDRNTLVLNIFHIVELTIRVEEAGA